MYHRYLGQDTENFDSVVVSSELFDKVVEKHSVDDLEFITYSLIIDGGTRDLLRHNNSLPVAVMDKILNRGVYTLFSRKVENAIKSDIINNLKDLGLEKAKEMILQSSKDDYYRNQKFVGTN
ncbi:MAG: hypothetical protein RMJ37_03475 [Spirochaetia bacterium]|nr:hypothetical protein [Spirochaetota bacterium]MDW8112388.1 hypothetical protein [Spirochaetia bacterium]